MIRKFKKQKKKILLTAMVAVILLSYLPALQNRAEAATTYSVDQLHFNYTTDAGVYRSYKGVLPSAPPIKIMTTLDYASGAPQVKVGDSVDRGSLQTLLFFGVQGLFDRLFGSDPASIPIQGFYVAAVTQAQYDAKAVCEVTALLARCSFEAETAHATTLPFPTNGEMDMDAENNSLFPNASVAGTSYKFYVFPVLDLPNTDAPLANVAISITVIIYDKQASYNAAATAAGQTPADFAHSGGTQSNVASGPGGTGAGDLLGGLLLSIVNIILGVILGLLRWLINVLNTNIFLPLLETTLQLEAGNIAGGPILAGWTYVRDIVNMIFILVLILIGLGTILRIESYNYKKLLVNVITMALLVNFSLLIGRIIIQIADVVQFTFLPEGDGINSIRTLYLKLYQTQTLWPGGFNLEASKALTATFTLLFQFVMDLGLALTFGALAIFMLIRTVALWILLIISPIAYALFVLPTTAGLAKKWWTTFFKYVFFAPIIAFFLRLSFMINDSILLIPNPGNPNQALPPPNLGDYLNKLTAGNSFTFGDSLQLALVYTMTLAFMWAGLIATRQLGIFGANAIVGLAEKGMKAPFAYGAKAAWSGTKALSSFGAEKFLEHTGIELRPAKWIEGWKQSREKSREAREAKGAAKALDRGSALASPVTFFQRYWNPAGIKRVLKGGEDKGRALLDKGYDKRKEADAIQGRPDVKRAEELKQQAARLEAEAESAPSSEAYDKRTQAVKLRLEAEDLETLLAPVRAEWKRLMTEARSFESRGAELIAPDDYFTQQKIRGQQDEELKTIHTDNWHELVDLFEGAMREGKPLRASAIVQHLTDTYNENELVNKTRYTRDYVGADGKSHKKDEFMTYSAAGMEDFRKLIMEEKLGLGRSASMMLMSDVSDLAEKRNHLDIMRMYVSEHGKMRLKTPEERNAEVSAEKDKMTTNKVLSDSNRLVGFHEVPDADYDITGKRTSYVDAHQVAYYLKNYQAVKFLLNRGQMNASQAKAAAEKHNADKILKAAELLDDKEQVEKIVGVSEILASKGLKDTRRQQYKEIMQQLVHYGATKGDSAAGKSKIEEVEEFYKRQGYT